jgi:2-oxoglutarate ferredoxin oxidoreductase subunit beta
MTLIVFNNMIYGLTTGQASPTSRGTENEPFNPVATAITQNISFAARAFARDIEQTKNIILEALNHKGFALVDVLTPCVSFNKINTYDWFAQNTFYLDAPQDRLQALRTEFENEKMPLGVLFKQDKPMLKSSTPLYKNRVDLAKLNSLMCPAAPSQGP